MSRVSSPFELSGSMLQLTWADAARLYHVFGLQLANVQFGTDFRAIWIFAASIADKIIGASMGYGDRRFSKGTGKTLDFISGLQLPNPRFSPAEMGAQLPLLPRVRPRAVSGIRGREVPLFNALRRRRRAAFR